MINIEINGNELYQSGKNCGVCGEANSTSITVAFLDDWEGYAKRIVFYDARGENPVTVLLTDVNKVSGEKETYVIKIPAEPLQYEGEIDYVVTGSAENEIKKTIGGNLSVRYAPDSTSEDIPAEVAQSVAEQLQAEAEHLAFIATKQIPYVGENRNWYVWNKELGEYVDTGVCAEGKDGYTPVKGVDYFDGQDGYTPVKGVDYFDGDKGDKGDKGETGNDGYTPQRGVDYWTDADKAEIKAYVDESIGIIQPLLEEI